MRSVEPSLTTISSAATAPAATTVPGGTIGTVWRAREARTSRSRSASSLDRM